MIKHINSYKFALVGIREIFLNHLNFRIEVAAAIVVTIFGILFKLNSIEWIIIIFTISFVLITESLNTAIETACDAIDQNYNKYIKYAKDISAGAVLISSIASVIIGLIIFIPHLTNT